MHNALGEIKIFAANANQQLANAVVDYLEVDMGKSTAGRFDDGEINMRVNETVRGMDVFIIQSTSPPVNENLMELLIMIDAMRRSSAGRITVVVPYFGYARQDRRARSHDPISAKLVADLITTAGANRILTMDLHCPQIQGFFNIPLDHLQGIYTFANYCKEGFGDLSDVVVVSPDFGSVARCNEFASLLNVPLAVADKRRNDAGVPEIANFIGTVEGKHAVIIDDVLSTGSSMCNAAAKVMDHGAKSVHAFITHPVLAKNATELIAKSVLSEVVVLDTIEIPKEKQHEKIKVISIARLIGKAIKGIHYGQSLGRLSKMGTLSKGF